MKINKYILIYIFLFLFNYNTIVEGQINDKIFFKDITYPKIDTTYNKYPDRSDVNYCSFSFDYIYGCSNGLDIEYSTFGPMDQINSYSSLLNLKDSKLNAITVLVSINISKVDFAIYLGGCGYIGDFNYTVSIQCHAIELEDLTFKTYPMEYYGSRLLSPLKIEGLKYPLKFSDNSLYASGNGEGFYEFNPSFFFNNIIGRYDIGIGTCSIILKTFNDSKVIIFETIYSKTTTNIVSDFKLYPSNLNDTQLFIRDTGGSVPIVTVKVKSNVYKPIFQLYSSKDNIGYPSAHDQFILLYGENDGTLVYYYPTANGLNTDYIINYSYIFQTGSYLSSLYNVTYLTQSFDLTNPFTWNQSLNRILSNYGYIIKLSGRSITFKFTPMILNSYRSPHRYSFPFGTVSSNGILNGFDYEFDILFSNETNSFVFNTYIIPYTLFFNKDLTPPVVKDFQIIYSKEFYYIIRVLVSAKNGVSAFDIDGVVYESIDTLVSGSLADGVFELSYSMELVYPRIITVYDSNSNYIQVKQNSILSIEPLCQFYKQSFDTLDLNSITKLSFDYYEMDVTNTNQYNTMYFNFSTFDNGSNYWICLNTNGINCRQAQWDTTSLMYSLKFGIVKNMLFGNFDYILVKNNYAQNSSAILKSILINTKFKPCVIKSSTPDVSGPFITNIVKLAGDMVNLNTNPLATVGWNITIEDKVNGFSNGYIVVQGLIDGTIYNFTLNSNNADKSITFTLLLSNISCVDQIFRFVQVSLYDTNNFNSYWDYAIVSYVPNPLMHMLNDQNIIKTQILCNPSTLDTSGPELVSITSSKSLIDFQSNDTSLLFTVIVQDLESGINIGQSPIIYITSSTMDKIECKSKLIKCLANDLTCTFQCEAMVPYGFGYPHQLLYQVYGIWNKQGILSGYSSSNITSLSLGLGYIDVLYSNSKPYISNINKFTNQGGQLIVFGKGFNSLMNIIINYYDYSIVRPLTCSFKSFCSINLGASDLPFTIQVETSSNILSNLYRVNPEYVGVLDSSSIEFACPGQPVCGGSSNGYCSSKGCICISPWYGIECKQKIIVVPQPSLNGTDPNITIILPPNENNNNNNNNNSSSSNSQIEYTSLTSIISLREIDINKQPIQTHPFSKWFNNQINSTFNEYYSNFTNINNIDKTTQVKVTVQWFNNQTNITFADTQFTINPSSIKYTIEIKEYPFKNKLNSLEIVMSASFKSNKDESCSSKEFGASNGYDNSDYLKLQVNDHSLYSRFIKRGIIDGNKTVSITNTLLDDSFTAVNQASETQSFIGISIPNFDNIAIVDPDFSVMLDYSKSSSNSICNKSSRLTSSQIAGIIIGSVGFALVITISAVYYYIKKRQHKKRISNIEHKLEAFKSSNELN